MVEERVGVVTFITVQRFHRFISPSHWIMEHTFGFGVEQSEQPKGRKKCEG